MLFEDAPQRSDGRGPGVLDFRIKSLDLALCALKHFVGERPGKTDHQVRVPELILKTPRRFDEYFGTTLVFPAQILVLATLISLLLSQWLK